MQQALVKAPGVISATVTQHPDKAIVHYNPSKTSPVKIARAVGTATGMGHYSATVVH